MSEYIVIGAGLAGAATAWALTARGENVTVLERHTPANARGSSHGSARIFRYAYPDRLYTELVLRARSLWDEVERVSETTVISPTGALDHGEARHMTRLIDVFDKVGVDHEVLSASAAQGRWPQFTFDSEVLWHPDAGVIDSELAVTTMLDLALRSGRARILQNWEATSVARQAGGGLKVTSAMGEVVEGSRVIVAAGGWLPALLTSIELPIGFLASLPKFEVRQEQAFHMPYRDVNEYGQLARAWPTFIHKSNELSAYGLPGGRDVDYRGQKLAQFNGGRVLGSALDQDGCITSEMRARMVEYANRYLPGLIPEPYAETTCLFTNTPTEDFVIDEADGIVVVSACSGHGAKFAPLLGEFAADLATGSGTAPDQFHAKC
ncbi:FAD-dependent oxidoreductase [Brevibacterium zhoupengii]|uniref:FAD-dependent oxidoreductase n=1 Tax=Brevibacterium zhoupengii TaxID=2898795 RepID=UPI001F09E216|nr:FAD-dependent oxidoreductase [Brevibacterium zhoupengii]